MLGAQAGSVVAACSCQPPSKANHLVPLASTSVPHCSCRTSLPCLMCQHFISCVFMPIRQVRSSLLFCLAALPRAVPHALPAALPFCPQQRLAALPTQPLPRLTPNTPTFFQAPTFALPVCLFGAPPLAYTILLACRGPIPTSATPCRASLP